MKGLSSKKDRYDHRAVEAAWQGRWREMKLDTPRIEDASKPFGKPQDEPFYNLMMFPYPSAEGLHVGNMYAFTGSDIYGRFKRMQGYSVLEPIGLDGFGIHSENYAFKVGRHPMDHAVITQKNFYHQLGAIGAMFDWTRTLETYDPLYYRWTQWMFVQMFKHGLAYRAEAEVNWCPSCKTVLADEQVIDGKCERCGNMVEKRSLKQWFFRITAYAEKLLGNLPSLDWSEKVKVAQERWIGKKEGINIAYQVVDETGATMGEEIVCFTTTPVNFAATFLAVAPEHPFVEVAITHLKGKGGSVSQAKGALKSKKAVPTAQSVTSYVQASAKKTLQERLAEGRKKTGVPSGLYAMNHVTGKRIPIWISDFVLMGVGTGAIQGCPGHDMRDFEFAMQFDIDIVRVVIGPDGDTTPISRSEQVIEHGPGKMIHSGFLDGLEFAQAMKKTMDYFEEKGWGKRVVTYHLRDWLLSRQRYWGPPIPMVFCSACETAKKGERADMPGWYTVPEDQLPVVLPRIDDYKPGDDGVAPLAKHKEFYHVACPECGKAARRETDVSDTFLDSSWYFLRYPSIDTKSAVTKPFDPEITKKWLPVYMYTGGAEHSVLHLMYSRFITMALNDWGLIDFDEPFARFFAHGLVIKDGVKMSKSKGNVVNPDEYIKVYGADALRLYLMFMGPFSQGGDFRDTAMEGMSRWVGRVWRIANSSLGKLVKLDKSPVSRALARLVKKVTDDLEARRYNTAIAAMMEFTNLVQDEGGQLVPEDLKTFTLLLAPFAPHLVEELWQRIQKLASGSLKLETEVRNLNLENQTSNFQPHDLTSNSQPPTSTKFQSVHLQPWPTFDLNAVVDETVEIAVQVNGKLRDTVSLDASSAADQKTVENVARGLPNVKKYLDGGTPRKVIFVPGRIINFVVV